MLAPMRSPAAASWGSSAQICLYGKKTLEIRKKAYLLTEADKNVATEAACVVSPTYILNPLLVIM